MLKTGLTITDFKIHHNTRGNEKNCHFGITIFKM